MRFAWLKKISANDVAVKQGCTHPLALIRMAYNAAFWVFVPPLIIRTIDYRVGFVAFTVVIFLRFAVNLYTNNVLKLDPDEYKRFPFRIA